ncbi:hypothetical protein ABK040_011898 [Willaertia magna]
MRSVVALCALFLLALGFAVAKECVFKTSAKEVGGISLKNVKPRPVNCPLGCETYVQSSSCLGWNGPIGALGPLGALGPISGSPFSPSAQFKFVGNFQEFFKWVSGSDKSLVLTNKENPLSAAGPLGDSFWDVMPSINDFTKHMQGGGLFSVLGPIGPLGALGPLGPLGPVGAHGYGSDKFGNYIDNTGKVQRKIGAVYNSSVTINWPLYEKYNQDFAKELGKQGLLDTSFMVKGMGSLNGDVYTITVTEPQYVTILVTPEILAKKFNLEVRSSTGVSVVKSESLDFTQWVQFYVSKSVLDAAGGSKKYDIIIKVDPLNCGLLSLVQCYMNYYLYVTGSTNWMLRRPHINYGGTYLQNC